MICKYCEDSVDKIINYFGTGICMDCYSRMNRWGKYNPKEDISDAERQKRLMWMHRETFLDDEDFYSSFKEGCEEAISETSL